jgi:hypothetical protein
VSRCIQKDCERTRYCRGLCTAHYRRKQRGQDMDAPLPEPRRHRRGLCIAGQCSNPVLARGLCNSHYRRKQRGREGWDAPLALRRVGAVNIGGLKVRPATKAALQRRAKSAGLSVYAMACAVLDTWADTIAVDAEKWRRGA